MILRILAYIILFSSLFSNENKWKFSADGSVEMYQENGETIQKFTDNVHIYNDSLSLYTDQAWEYQSKNEIHLKGNAILISKNDSLNCDSMVYWIDKDSLVASGSVFMKSNNIILEANQFFLWKDNGFRKYSFDSSGNVGIESNNNKIFSNSISYDDNNQTMYLKNNTKIINSSNQMFADSMTIIFEDSLFSNIHSLGNVKIKSNVNGKLNKNGFLENFVDQMNGHSMVIDYTNGEIDSLHIYGMATSFFHVIEDTLLMGVNDVSGDSIRMKFNDSYLRNITVNGGSRGVFNPEKANSNIDTTIIYKGEKIDYYLDTEETYLNKKASVSNLETELKSGLIHVDWQKNLLKAYEKYDEIPIVVSNTSEPMEGKSLSFDLVEKKGTINKGKTKYNDSYYHGHEIFRHGNEVFYVNNSMYTSCDHENPHYYLWSNKMKMLPNNKIIARPLRLHIYDFPVFWLPFAVLPNESSKRHSGWIMPDFGTTNRQGTFMRNLGYYWAPNDYFDAVYKFSFYDRQGIFMNSKLTFKKRYKYNGYLSTSLIRELLNTTNIDSLYSNQSKQEWDLKLVYNYIINPIEKSKSEININMTYVSNNDFYIETGQDSETRTKQNIISTFNYYKKWGDIKSSLLISYNDTYNLLGEKKVAQYPGQLNTFRTINFPNLQFSLQNRTVFGVGDKWYNSIYWNGSSNLRNTYQIGYVASLDTTWRDTTANNNSISNSMRFSYVSTMFGWLTLNTSVNLKEDWIFRYKDHSVSDLENNYKYENGFMRRLTGSTDINLSSIIYGIIPLDFGNLSAMKHIVSPSIGFTYRPDFTKAFLGKMPNYMIKGYDNQYYDSFTGSNVGSTPSLLKQEYQFTLQNLFYIKYIDEKDEIMKEQILSWNLQANYNAAADSAHLSSITSKINTKIPKINLDLSIKSTHDIYERINNGTSITRINKFKNTYYDFPLPYLTQLSVSTSLNLSGKAIVGFIDSSEVFNDNNSLFDKHTIISSDKKLWTLNLGINYNLNQKIINSLIDWEEKFNISSSLKINLTKNWEIRYSNTFDVVNQEIVNNTFTFKRPLHCWDFNFIWWPNGTARGFRLNISVRNDDLSDIKIETQRKRSQYFNF